MFGPNRESDNLTYQTRNESDDSRAICIYVMDEAGLITGGPHVRAMTLGLAWCTGRAVIRDYPHAGGPDSRLHLTVVVSSGVGRGTYHVPCAFLSATQLVLDDPTGDVLQAHN